MKPKFSLLAFSLLLVAGLAVLSAGAQAKEFRAQLRLKAGESYTAYVASDTNTVQTVQGNQLAVRQSMTLGYTYDVLDVDASGVTSLNMTINSVQFKVESPQGRLEWSSAAGQPSSPPPAAAAALSAFVGATISMKLSPEGRVLEVSGLDAIYDRMLTAMNPPDEATKSMVKKVLSEQFGDNAINGMMQDISEAYLGRTVNVGDSWPVKMTIAKGVPMIIDGTYTLTSLENGVARMGVSAAILPNPDGAPMKIGEMTLRIGLTGEETGYIDVDEETGWVVQGELKTKFTGALSLEGVPDLPADMLGPMTSESTVRISSTPFVD